MYFQQILFLNKPLCYTLFLIFKGFFMTDTIKVYLDDERETPDGFVRVYWPDDAIALLEQGNVSVISLDHDLGDDERGTGYDVVLWIEEQVYTTDYTPPTILVHSANSSAKAKMMNGINTIYQKRSPV
jgi:hypothetical protein